MGKTYKFICTCVIAVKDNSHLYIRYILYKYDIRKYFRNVALKIYWNKAKRGTAAAVLTPLLK
jgi:hypothetical protein